MNNKEDRVYIKLSDLVDTEFTIEKVYGYKWKMWDQSAKRMLVSDSYEKGYRKVYAILTDRGQLDIGSGQIGSLLEAVIKDGVADLNNKRFGVKSNGKTGMDIRYYFNAVRQSSPAPANSYESSLNDSEPIDLSEIPF